MQACFLDDGGDKKLGFRGETALQSCISFYPHWPLCYQYPYLRPVTYLADLLHIIHGIEPSKANKKVLITNVVV